MNSLVFTLLMVGADPSGHFLQIQQGSESAIVELKISLGDRGIEDSWRQFLGTWRTRFDRDHDGKIDRQELKAVPRLFNSKNVGVVLDVATIDSNGDGLLDLPEIQTGYHTQAIQAVSTIAPELDHAAIQVADSLWQLLDLNRDDRLTRDELSKAHELLNRWDRNDDERLAADELPLDQRSTTDSAVKDVLWWIKSGPPTGTSGQRVSIELPDWKPSAGKHSPIKPVVRSEFMETNGGLEELDNHRWRLSVSSVKLVVHLGESTPQRMIAAEKYLMGEIDTVIGEGNSIAENKVRSEPTLDWLVPLIEIVDVNQDGLMDRSEIQSWLNLLTEGATSQVSLSISLRGRNLFDHLDANGDNQLELRELAKANQLPHTSKDRDGAEADSLRRDQVPLSLELYVRRGPLSGRFARLRIAKRSSEPTASEAPMSNAPRWFKSMDRNHDQTISPSEFLGSPVRFAELDTNGDGVIAAEEVTSARPESP